MRKVLGLLFATSLLLPIGLVSAGPAGSAVKGPTCKTLVAKGTFNPPLPKLGVKTLITSTVKSTGKIGGCTGGGVTGGTSSVTYKYKGNCTTNALNKGYTITNRVSSILWSNGQSSTTVTTTKTLSAPGVQPSHINLTTQITKGQFAGTSSTVLVYGTSVKNACITSTLATFTLTGHGTAVFK